MKESRPDTCGESVNSDDHHGLARHCDFAGGDAEPGKLENEVENVLRVRSSDEGTREKLPKSRLYET